MKSLLLQIYLVMFKLLNGETVKLNDFIGDINCDDMNMFYSLTQENIDKLLKSPIEKIRVQGSENYSDIEKVKSPNFFIDNFTKNTVIHILLLLF